MHGLFLISFGAEVDAISYYKISVQWINEGWTIFDCFSIFEQANFLWGSAKTAFFQSVIFVVVFLSGGSYLGGVSFLFMFFILSLVSCINSLLCSNQQYTISLNSEHRTLAIASLSLFPSQLFWTSTFVKEALLLPLNLLLLSVFIKIWLNQGKTTFLNYFVLIIVGLGLYLIRPPFLLMYVAVICGMVLRKELLLNYAERQLFRYFFYLTTGGVVFGMFQLGVMDSYLQESEGMFINYYDSGNATVEYGEQFGKNFNNGYRVFLYLPLVLITVILRPFIWEIGNLISLFAGIENLFILIFIWRLRSGIRYWRGSNNYIQLGNALTLIAIVGFSVVGLGSFNLGSISRYRSPMLGVFMLGLILSYYEQLKQKAYLGKNSKFD